MILLLLGNDGIYSLDAARAGPPEDCDYWEKSLFPSLEVTPNQHQHLDDMITTDIFTKMGVAH